MVHAYRELGHFVAANLDPLGHQRPPHALLDISEYGFERERPGPPQIGEPADSTWSHRRHAPKSLLERS